MSKSVEPEIRAILKTVANWDSQRRLALAKEILATVDLPPITPPPKKLNARDLIGILKTDRAAPTDEECQRIIDEERRRKFG